MAKPRVMTILGTRPEIIRLSRVLPMLDSFTEHTVLHTGQNYDEGLNGLFFDELALRPPDKVIDFDRSTLGTGISSIIVGVEAAISEMQPDAVLVLGDTNSCLGAIVAKRMHVPVYHMEAGNRCFDENVPEEINRRIIDHTADFNLPYTEHARRHLLAEGLHPRRIVLTGSPLKQVIDHYRPLIDASNMIDRLDLEPKRFFLASFHREENVDNPSHLTSILDALQSLRSRYGFPVIVSTHPRTRQELGQTSGDYKDELQFLEPLGYFDYNALQQRATCVLSDSGSIGEEAAILSFPAVTMRNSTERPEALESGVLMIAGLVADDIADRVTDVVELRKAGHQPVPPNDYMIDNCAERVTSLILGTTGLSKVWSGLI